MLMSSEYMRCLNREIVDFAITFLCTKTNLNKIPFSTDETNDSVLFDYVFWIMKGWEKWSFFQIEYSKEWDDFKTQ